MRSRCKKQIPYRKLTKKIKIREKWTKNIKNREKCTEKYNTEKIDLTDEEKREIDQIK